eukprot:TRINITY_DN4759_c0_g1_i3.p1 TRINITY_DN4759_c0_g1~~TRINITY_DN4759_c0_g1_i3.p1  ORF type:complete len:183 (-),score=67.34 TRINITY_DN4759_c0_g1_i3:443-991(-)
MGIVECIDSKGSGNNVLCIPHEDHLKLRYLLVFKSEQVQMISVSTSKLGLNEHYYEYVGKLKAKNERELQERIMKRMGAQEESKGVKEETKSKAVFKIEHAKDTGERFVAKITKLDNDRLWKEYTSLLTSDNLHIISVAVKDNDNYVWRVTIDTSKHELNPDLKRDFGKIKTLTGNVMFAQR